MGQRNCYCGKVIPRKAGRGRPALFCSAECRAAHKRKSDARREQSRAWIPQGVPCDVCNKPTWSPKGKDNGTARHLRCKPPVMHGTRSGYQDAACKCHLCTEWNRVSARDYRDQRRAQGRPVRNYGQSGPWISAATRTTVYVRDGWVCQLCNEPTDRNAPPNSDWYPSLDHIVPQSKGGQHTVANLRVAHRWCNSARGAHA